MSTKAFDVIPVIDTAQLLADLRPQTKVQIDSLESSGNELFLGTYDGLILVYQFEEKQDDNGKTICVAHKVRERYLSTRKSIRSIKVASASERLLVQSNNCIFLLSLSSLEPLGSQLSGVTTYCVNENPVDIDDPFAIQICVAMKKKLEVHNANETKFTMVIDVPLSEPVSSVGVDGNFVCVAMSSRYKIYNFKTKVVQELFDFPTERFIPIVRRIQQGEFLLSAPEGLGMFVTTEGSSNRAPIQWTSQAADFGLSGVICTAYYHPYILAICGNFIVVHSILDQQQKQSEHFSGGISLGNFDGRIFVCSSTSVFRLGPVAWEKQVQALLADKRVDEALELAQNATYTGCSKEQLEKISQRVKQQAAFAYFSMKEFDKAREMFINSNTDIREVISLFPNLLPQSSTFIRAIPSLHDIADVDQLFHRDAEIITEARYCLHHLLEDIRETFNAQLQHQFELDTALVKLYAESNKDDLTAFILAGDVRCDTRDCLQWLEKLGCFNAMALLHRQSKHQELALDYWAKLASGELSDDSFHGLEFFVECLANTKDMDLVWRHATFVLEKDEELGAKIFTTRGKDPSFVPLDVNQVAEYLQKFPAALVNYLEYLVLEEKNQNEKYHSQLAVIYLDAIVSSRKNGGAQDELRRKFQRFLQESNLYRAQTVLSKIKGMGLDQETATLYGKIGEHDKALNILVHRLKDYKAAEDYCEANKKSDLFQSLLNCYLDPQLDEDRRKELVEPALDLINRRAKMFNMAQVLEVLPQELSVTVIDSFLRGALRSSMHQYRMRKVESALAKGENINRRHALHNLQKDTVFLQPTNYCCVCKKPFLDGSFARYPNNVITHINCAKQNDVCPLTGRVFRLPDTTPR